MNYFYKPKKNFLITIVNVNMAGKRKGKIIHIVFKNIDLI